MDSSRLSISTYFGMIANALVKQAQYVRNVNILGGKALKMILLKHLKVLYHY